jgi:transposase
MLVKKNPWLLETHSDIRYGAVADFITSYDTSRKKHGLGRFTMSYRKKKATSQSMYLAHRSYNGHPGVCYPDFWKKGKLKLKPLQIRKEELKKFKWTLCDNDKNANVVKLRKEEITPSNKKWDGKTLEPDGRFVLKRPNLWFIQRVFKLPRGETQVGGNVASLDPGVRTFQTIYDPVREAYIEFGGGDSTQNLFKRCLRMDKIQSLANQKETKHKLRYRLLNRVLPRLRYKFKNLVADLHRRTAIFLCKNYDTILLPALPTSKLSTRAQRRLRSKTVRSMLGWSHYAFRRAFVLKAEEYGCKVVTVGEEYTTKSCGKCGVVRASFSGKVFKCSQAQCGFKTDRDWNGSRNICIKTLSLFSIPI